MTPAAVETCASRLFAKNSDGISLFIKTHNEEAVSIDVKSFLSFELYRNTTGQWDKFYLRVEYISNI